MLDANTFYTRPTGDVPCVLSITSLLLYRLRESQPVVVPCPKRVMPHRPNISGNSLTKNVARSLPSCPLHSSTIRTKGASECATIMYGRSFWLAVKAREFVVFSSSFVVEPD